MCIILIRILNEFFFECLYFVIVGYGEYVGIRWCGGYVVEFIGVNFVVYVYGKYDDVVIFSVISSVLGVDDVIRLFVCNDDDNFCCIGMIECKNVVYYWL